MAINGSLNVLIKEDEAEKHNFVPESRKVLPRIGLHRCRWQMVTFTGRAVSVKVVLFINATYLDIYTYLPLCKYDN